LAVQTGDPLDTENPSNLRAKRVCCTRRLDHKQVGAAVVS